ncbi:MAG: DsbA family protein [Blastomonas fulva]|uniref:DsbA family protein n=1 Tax=Blastomonas fulva TaxID=1550728 RepID=UPI0040347F53
MRGVFRASMDGLVPKKILKERSYAMNFYKIGRLVLLVGAGSLAFIAQAQTFTVVYPQSPDSSGLRAIVQDAVRELLQKEPELVANALRADQARQEQQAKDAQAASAQAAVQAAARAKIDPKVPSIGPADGKTVVEFFDYNCGYCKTFAAQTVVGVQAARKDVRWAFVYTPILGAGSKRLAEFAAAAQLQGQFEAAHDYLLGLKQTFASSEAADGIREELIVAASLDREQFEKALQSGEARAIVDHHMAYATQARISGTPVLVTGTTYVPGFVPPEILLQHIG